MKRSHRLIILVHGGEFAGLKVDADRGGLSVSDHVRALLGLAARARGVRSGAAAAGPSRQEKPGGNPGTPA